jgi:hypothetical protein
MDANAQNLARHLAHSPARWLVGGLVVVLSGWLLAPAPAMAQREIDEQIKRSLKKREVREHPVFVGLHLGWSGTYRPGRWVPMHLFIDPPDEPLGGVLTLDVPQDSFHRMMLEQDYALTPGSQLQMVLYGQLGTMDQVVLTLRNQRGRERLYVRVDHNALLPNPAGQSLIVGVVGDRSTIDASTPVLEPYVSNDGATRNWVARWEAEARLPRAWVGYDVLDGLVLAGPNWSLIAPESGEAIAHWVERGGRLLVYGAEAPPLDHPIRRILPLAIADPKRVEITQAVTLQIGTRFSTATSAVVSDLELQAEARGWTRLHDGDAHYVAGGPVGFGWVTYLGVHPADLVVGSGEEARDRGADAGEAKRFVATLIDRTLDRTLAEAVPISLVRADRNDAASLQMYAMRGWGGPGEAAASQVLNVLSQIPGLGPISFLWIGGLLTSLLVLLGPVDYFALRRLGRLPWTWYTVTGYIVLFSGIGFWIAHTRRLGTTQLRRASVVDSVQGQSTGYQTGVTVVYASRSGGYQPDDPRPDRWWSSYLPSTNYGFGDQRAGTQLVFYRQSAGCAVTRLPIPVANIRCLRDQSTAEALDVVVTRSADGSGYQLVNRGPLPIRNGKLFELDGGQVRESSFNRVEAGASVTVSQPRNPAGASSPLLHGSDPDQSYSYYFDEVELPQSPNVPRNALARMSDAYERTEGIYAWLRSGAVVLWAEVEPEIDFSVPGHETNNYHLQLHRIVIPRETLDAAGRTGA